jgi:ferredoxin
MTGKLKVSIDRKGCINCRNCWNTCPEFFEQNPKDTYSQICPEYRIENNPGKGEAPRKLAEMVKKAADLCPVRIIQIHVFAN